MRLRTDYFFFGNEEHFTIKYNFKQSNKIKHKYLFLILLTDYFVNLLTLEDDTFSKITMVLVRTRLKQ